MNTFENIWANEEIAHSIALPSLAYIFSVVGYTTLYN